MKEKSGSAPSSNEPIAKKSKVPDDCNLVDCFDSTEKRFAAMQEEKIQEANDEQQQQQNNNFFVTERHFKSKTCGEEGMQNSEPNGQGAFKPVVQGYSIIPLTMPNSQYLACQQAPAMQQIRGDQRQQLAFYTTQQQQQQLYPQQQQQQIIPVMMVGQFQFVPMFGPPPLQNGLSAPFDVASALDASSILSSMSSLSSGISALPTSNNTFVMPPLAGAHMLPVAAGAYPAPTTSTTSITSTVQGDSSPNSLAMPSSSNQQSGGKVSGRKRSTRGGDAGRFDRERFQEFLKSGSLVCDRCARIHRHFSQLMCKKTYMLPSGLRIERWGGCPPEYDRKSNHMQTICYECKAIFIDNFSCQHHPKTWRNSKKSRMMALEEEDFADSK